MPKTIPMLIEVEDIAVGHFLRLLEKTPGIAKYAFDMRAEKKGTPAANANANGGRMPRRARQKYATSHDEAIVSLRGSTAAVADHLKLEVQQRLQKAGVEVLEARFSHLAYAPEIAAAMLQRQQAGAIIAAREQGLIR